MPASTTESSPHEDRPSKGRGCVALVLGALFWTVTGLQLLGLGGMLFFTLASGLSAPANQHASIARDILAPAAWFVAVIFLYRSRPSLVIRALALLLAVAPLLYMTLRAYGSPAFQVP